MPLFFTERTERINMENYTYAENGRYKLNFQSNLKNLVQLMQPDDCNTDGLDAHDDVSVLSVFHQMSQNTKVHGAKDRLSCVGEPYLLEKPPYVSAPLLPSYMLPHISSSYLPCLNELAITKSINLHISQTTTNSSSSKSSSEISLDAESVEPQIQSSCNNILPLSKEIKTIPTAPPATGYPVILPPLPYPLTISPVWTPTAKDIPIKQRGYRSSKQSAVSSAELSMSETLDDPQSYCNSSIPSSLNDKTLPIATSAKSDPATSPSPYLQTLLPIWTSGQSRDLPINKNVYKYEKYWSMVDTRKQMKTEILATPQGKPIVSTQAKTMNLNDESIQSYSLPANHSELGSFGMPFAFTGQKPTANCQNLGSSGMLKAFTVQKPTANCQNLGSSGMPQAFADQEPAVSSTMDSFQETKWTNFFVVSNDIHGYLPPMSNELHPNKVMPRIFPPFQGHTQKTPCYPPLANPNIRNSNRAISKQYSNLQSEKQGAPRNIVKDQKIANRAYGQNGNNEIKSLPYSVEHLLPVYKLGLTNDPSSRLPTKSWKKKFQNICNYCRNNREMKSVYMSHKTHENGIVTCPVLRKYTCPICRATGDNAHTLSYCPVGPKQSMAPLYHSSIRKSCGLYHSMTISNKNTRQG